MWRNMTTTMTYGKRNLKLYHHRQQQRHIRISSQHRRPSIRRRLLHLRRLRWLSQIIHCWCNCQLRMSPICSRPRRAPTRSTRCSPRRPRNSCASTTSTGPNDLRTSCNMVPRLHSVIQRCRRTRMPWRFDAPLPRPCLCTLRRVLVMRRVSLNLPRRLLWLLVRLLRLLLLLLRLYRRRLA
jgi:hypothetical protein